MQLTKAMNSFQASTLAETAVARSFCRTFCNPITLVKKTPKRGCDGFSLVEAVFACALVAVFFIGIFGLNSQCLLFANSSRELMSAGQSLQARMEQLRALTWTKITDATAIQTLLTPAVSPTNSLGAVTEVVTIYKYPPPANPTPTPIQLTRVANGTANVTPTINTTNATLASGDMVQVNMKWTWQAAPNSRQRSMSISTIYGKNTQQ
jgi:Tfp pilus assembly protein PilV